MVSSANSSEDSRLRILGIDFGGKRIGLAVVDTEIRLPEPRGVLQASGTLAKDALAIRAIAQGESIATVVVGLPLDLDGETQMSRICRLLGQRLEETGLSVQFVDESMTSQEAERAMRDAGMTAAEIRQRVDSEAACRILERFMEGDGSQT